MGERRYGDLGADDQLPPDLFEGETFWGMWDCPNCLRPGISGKEMRCPSCSHEKTSEVRHYYDRESIKQVIREQKELAVALGGKDWECIHCHALNRALGNEDDPLCSVCGMWQVGYIGGPQNKEELEQVRAGLQDARGQVHPGQRSSLASSEEIQQRENLANLSTPKSNQSKWIVVSGGVLFAIVLTFFGFQWFLSPSAIVGQISNLSWETTVKVQKYQTVTQTTWADRPPVGVDNLKEISRWREQRGTRLVQKGTKTEYRSERVKVGEQQVKKYREVNVQVGTRRVKAGVRDNGNGSFTQLYKEEPIYETRREPYTTTEPIYERRDVPHKVPNMVEQPVYAQKVKWQFNQWRDFRTLHRRGKKGQPRTYASIPQLSSPDYRVASRSEKCLIAIAANDPFRDRSPNRIYNPPITCSQLEQWSIGDRLQIEVTRSGNAKIIGNLAPR